MRILSLPREGTEYCAGETAAVLRHPGAVALVPTETVYGLIARADDEAAAARIFALKRRPASKVLGYFAPSRRELEAFGAELKGLPGELIAKYAPGPLTVIAPLREGGTVGFRLPDFPFLAALLVEMACMLVQTSANRSGGANPLTVASALEQLDGDPDIVVDGGAIPSGALASTVVDATGSQPRILRQGALRIEP